MPREERHLVITTAIAAALMAGCSAPAESTPTSPTSSSPVGPNDVGADLPDLGTPPTDDAASRTAAEAAAVATMTAFIQVDLGPDQWLADLAPHLTAAAHNAYFGTDPLEVPARQVTGPARYDGSTSAYLATVTVPTDVGDYRLLLVREDQDSPWLAETLTPPEGLR